MRSIEERTASLRRSMLRTDLPRVRRSRHFWVEMVDHPTLVQDPQDRSLPTFASYFERQWRPALARVDHIAVFPPATAAVHVPPAFLAEWQAAGARPDHWQAAYVVERGGQATLDLRPEVLEDLAFWWWTFWSFGAMRLAMVWTLDNFDAPALFRELYDPKFISNSRLAQPQERYARQQTARQERVAIVRGGQMGSVSVIAGAPQIERLFRIAVEHVQYSVV
jgi:hypothetical protein